MSKFIHLHNYSDFSLLEAAQSIKSIVDIAHNLSMDSIALTEKGNLFSMVSFYKYAKKKGIKPIIGCDLQIKSTLSIQKNNSKTFSIVILAKNNTGYSNLMKLVSLSHIESENTIPHIDMKLLEKYKDGLIITSSGLDGELTYYACNEDYDNAEKVALKYQHIFKGDFYIEIQNHQLSKEIASHKILNKLSQDLSINLVATNQTYYNKKVDASSCEVIKCIGTGHNLNDPNRVKAKSDEYYIKSTDEMTALFKDYPKAILNTVKISNQCNVDIPMGKLFLPSFPIPSISKSSNTNQYLKELCEKAIKKRYAEKTSEIEVRLKYELDIIYKMGFSSYFLITQDFVKYAKDNKIPVGPGRGSAVGSLVSYLTGITDLDPLKYNLIFERFLNPDRVSMPDIDIDFCIEGRERVINYIKEKYGHKSVAQIITFGSMKAKSVIRDVGRVLGMSYGDVDKIAKMIPNDLNMTIDKAQKLNKDLNKIINQDMKCKELIHYSKKLEGLHRHASTHAAGIVIAPGPLMNYVPLFKNPATHDITTQIEMNSLEEIGLLKLDFLGLRNLTVINKTIMMINKNYNEIIDINNIDLSDAKVFKLFSDGNTIGIFQFESRGMRDYLRQLKPTCIEDLIAMNSLYRPGPMANIPDFLSRKHDSKKIVYLHPELESILKETYGIIVYQEQVMQIGSVIGGFTLAQSDEMRRAMGKKKKDLMATFKIDFVKGAEQKGLDSALATEIFDLLEKFAEYGFNKSHSAAYSVIAYQTAWLKTYYPAEFMASNLSSDLLNTDSIIKLLRNIKTLNIEILKPDVNSSATEFISQNPQNIVYGLAGIKNVGYKSIQKLIAYRDKNGTFNTIFDLCKIGSHYMNKKVLESLIKAGACDKLEGNRAQQYALIEQALKFGQRHQEDLNTMQSNLFSSEALNDTYIIPSLPDIEDWDQTIKLDFEKNILGFYLSGNPLEKYLDELKSFTNVGVYDSNNKVANYKIGGRIFDIKVLYDKKNNPWTISRLECYNGTIVELFSFSDTYIKYQELFINDNIIYIEGEPSRQAEENSFKIITKKIFYLTHIREKLSNSVNLKISFETDNPEIIDNLYSVSKNFPGTCKLVLHILNSKGVLKKIQPIKILVSNKIESINQFKSILGDNNVWLS